jgi:hypothetical protein
MVWTTASEHAPLLPQTLLPDDIIKSRLGPDGAADVVAAGVAVLKCRIGRLARLVRAGEVTLEVRGRASWPDPLAAAANESARPPSGS